MRKTLIAAATVAVAAGLLVPGAVANANEASQSVDFTVQARAGGGLSVTTAGGYSSLALVSESTKATGTLTLFGVNDYRGTSSGWNASIALGDFVHQGDATIKIPATNATYTPGTINGLNGGGSATGGQNVQLKNEPTVVVQRSERNRSVLVENATWMNVNALTVDIPGDVALGQYKATLTLSAV